VSMSHPVESSAQYCHEALFPIFQSITEDISEDEKECSSTLSKWVTRLTATEMFSDRLQEWLYASTPEELSELRSMLERSGTAHQLPSLHGTLRIPRVIQA
jgi:hypothetical protein